jgi:hypothetical protein
MSMWIACHASYDSRRRTARSDSRTTVTSVAAATMPSKDAVTPARAPNVLNTEASSSRA